MSEEVIKVEGLTKVFNHSLTAVDHIDFSVRREKSLVFLDQTVQGKPRLLAC